MLQECNKFREHQAHEFLIELLEKQLLRRKKWLRELQAQIRCVEEHMIGTPVVSNPTPIVSLETKNETVPMDINE